MSIDAILPSLPPSTLDEITADWLPNWVSPSRPPLLPRPSWIGCDPAALVQVGVIAPKKDVLLAARSRLPSGLKAIGPLASSPPAAVTSPAGCAYTSPFHWLAPVLIK